MTTRPYSVTNFWSDLVAAYEEILLKKLSELPAECQICPESGYLYGCVGGWRLNRF